MLVPLGVALSTSTAAPSSRSAVGAARNDGAVAAVDDDPHAVEATAFERVDEIRDVGVARTAVLARDTDLRARWPTAGIAHREIAQLVLDPDLERLGDLAPAGREQLDRRCRRTGCDWPRSRRPVRRDPRAMCATPGVGITPTSTTSAPSAQIPATSAASIIGPERRVSRPTTKGCSAPMTRTAARPSAVTSSTVSSSFATPRTPSVPKRRVMTAYDAKISAWSTAVPSGPS